MNLRRYIIATLLCIFAFAMPTYAQEDVKEEMQDEIIKGEEPEVPEIMEPIIAEDFELKQEVIELYPTESTEVSLYVEENVNDEYYQVVWTIEDLSGVLSENVEGGTNTSKVYTALNEGIANIHIEVIDVMDADNPVSVVSFTCTINVLPFPTSIVDSNSVSAVGVTQTLTLSDTTDMTTTWTSSDSTIVIVDEYTGSYTGVKEGTAVIYANIVKGEHSFTLEKQVTITNPKLTAKRLVLAVGKSERIKLVGLSSDSTVTWLTLSKSKAVVKNGKVTAKKKGTATININADGKVLKVSVIVTNPKISKTTFVLTKKMTATIKVKGTNKYSSVEYVSGNKKVVKVNKKGKLTPKGYGSTTVKVKVDGKTIKCVVTVGKKKAVYAVRRAYKVIGSPYSQYLRMLEGYYDCSSLAWRCYKPYGIHMGVKGSWAPTAAAQAEYFAQTPKVIYKKPVSYKKLKVGDLIYYDADSTPNWRYLGIDHVALYVGAGKIIHANGTTMSVAEADYKELKKYIVCIARPIK